jgi:uncharacterized protein (DUF58 family)
MREILAGFTTRGRSFIAAGAASVICGLLLGELGLFQIGLLLFVLPLLAALAASRTRYQLTCQRTLSPTRVQADQPALVTVRLENTPRLRSGVLLAEDGVPYALGGHPRFVLDGIEGGGSREISYRIHSGLRGKFTIGPLQVRVADAFGMVEISRSFRSRSTLTVTPKLEPLPGVQLSGAWLGTGDRRARTVAAAGDDDVAPRSYREGDDLRRVHWRSTARYGELMVRREEQQWHARASLFLDTRASAHSGSGSAFTTTSSFEYAVSAAASIGVRLAREQFDAQLITDEGPAATDGPFEDALLDTLAVVRTSRNQTLGAGLPALSASPGGLVIAVTGHLTDDQARLLAGTCHRPASAIAVLLDVMTWSGSHAAPSPRRPARRSQAGQDAAEILSAAGWQVLTITAGTPLAAAWGQLHRAASGSVGAAAGRVLREERLRGDGLPGDGLPGNQLAAP